MTITDLRVVDKSRFDDRGIELAEHMVHAIRREPDKLGTFFREDEVTQALKALDTVRELTKV